MDLRNQKWMACWKAALSPAIAYLAITEPAASYDLQYRQNNTNFSGAALQAIFNQNLPATYDQAFPEQQWTTYLLLDAHPDQGLTAITLGLSPRIGAKRALLPIATYSVITPIPVNTQQWQRLLGNVVNTYGKSMLSNRVRILNQR